MQMIRKIVVVFSALFALIFVGCAKNDDILPEQQKKIVTFLTGGHNPKLISEQDAETSLETNPPYYSSFGNTAYRYIADIYNPERASKAEVAVGDAVSITFRAYLFSGGAPTMADLYYTNDPTLKEALVNDAGLNAQYWSFEPLTIILGRTEILKGLSASLVGCREGDVVEVYMTYKMAYGSNDIGTVPKDSPVALFFTITKVEKTV